MLDIKKNYIGTYPEFRSVIPQLDNGRNVTIRRRVTVLESDEVKQRHAEVKKELGLDDNFQPAKPKVIPEIDGRAGDPAYYRETLGNTEFDWEEI